MRNLLELFVHQRGLLIQNPNPSLPRVKSQVSGGENADSAEHLRDVALRPPAPTLELLGRKKKGHVAAWWFKLHSRFSRSHSRSHLSAFAGLLTITPRAPDC